jgi:hypothetical protein
VGDDGDGVVGLQFVDQFLDLRRRNRIERGGRFVEQDHFGLCRHGARDAKPLLLAAGQAQAGFLQLVLDLVPKRGALQRMFDAVGQFAARQALIEIDAESDVVMDRHGKRRRLLEHHADLGAQEIDVLLAVENVFAVEQNLAFRALARIELVNPVHHAQERRLPATGRPDEGGHLAVVKRKRNILQRPVLAVIEGQVLYIDPRFGLHRPHVVHCKPRLPSKIRARMLRRRTAAVIRRAAAQASSCQP